MIWNSPYCIFLWLALVANVLSERGCYCNALLSFQSSSRASTSSRVTHAYTSNCVVRTRRFLFAGLHMTKQDDMNNINDDDDDADNSQHETHVLVPLPQEEEKDEPISLAELAQLEERASRRILQRLLLPTRIGEAITFGVQLFVVFGLFLNLNGYGYVIRNDGSHWIGIDTLENRQFQMELRKRN